MSALQQDYPDRFEYICSASRDPSSTVVGYTVRDHLTVHLHGINRDDYPLRPATMPTGK